MNCPYCGSENFGRNPKMRFTAPLGKYTLRYHLCWDCNRDFMSLLRVATQRELEDLADRLEAEGVA